MKIIFLFLLFLLQMGSVKAQNFSLDKSINGLNKNTTAINFRSEDNLLVTGGENGKLSIWNTENGENIKNIQGHEAKISHIEFSNNGEIMATAAYDGKIKIWKVEDMQLIKSFDNPKIPAYATVKGIEATFVVFSSDDKSVYFGGYNMKISKGNIESGEIKVVYNTNKAGITCAMMSPDNKYLSFGSGENLFFLNLNNQNIDKQISKSEIFDDYVCEVAFVPETDLVAFWGYAGKVHFYDWKTSQYKYTINATNEKGTSNVAFTENGKLMITGNDQQKTKIWNIANKTTIQTLEEHSSPVNCFAFSQNGDVIVTADNDKKINVWKNKIIEEQTSTSTTPTMFEGREVKIQQTIKTKDENIELVMWDRGQEDGDIISLSLNGSWVLREFELTRRKKSVKVKLKRGNNLIIMYAHNEGRVSPNTAAVAIKEGRKEKNLTLNSNLRTCAALNVNFNPE